MRKKMVSMILATDMINHGKVMDNIHSKVPKDLNVPDKEGKIQNEKFDFIPSGTKNILENQQALLDYFIHAADLAHNTKLFTISLQWVELLSNEFWCQGDKEKSLNLPVSFLCEREVYDIPASQIGFIKGFILSTFDPLIRLLPALTFMVNNAKDNLRKWEDISKEGRKRGWTPPKKSDENLNSKSFKISSKKEVHNNINICPKNNNEDKKMVNIKQAKTFTLKDSEVDNKKTN